MLSYTDFANATLFVSCYQPKLFDAATEVSLREARLVLPLVQRSLYTYKILDKTNRNCSSNSLFFIKCTQDRKNALLSVLTCLVLCCFGGFIIY